MKRLLSFTVLVVITFGPIFSQVTKGDSPFYEQMRTLLFEEREALILKEITSGNIPDYLKGFVTVKTVQKDTKGHKHKVTLFVKPDYLSIGNNQNSFIIPMGPVTAQKIADFFDCSLPTPKVVDIIYNHSVLKLEPFNYIPRDDRNETPDILNDHSRVIFAKVKAAEKMPGVFVAGTKKDVVISSKLSDTQRTHHVTIYGWHKLDGKAIQPVYNHHIDTYVDYSHGIRLISNKVLIDGKEYNYRKILKDPTLHSLLSDEPNPLVKTSYLEK
ncbi:MAG: hypothetical protein WCX48_06495 [Bacteroidales bacterium]